MTNPSDGIAELIAKLRFGPIWSNGEPIGAVVGEVNGATMTEAATALETLLDLLRRVEPHLDAITCHASTMGEHEPNRIARDVRKALGGRP